MQQQPIARVPIQSRPLSSAQQTLICASQGPRRLPSPLRCKAAPNLCVMGGAPAGLRSVCHGGQPPTPLTPTPRPVPI
eukprot:6767509-Pyramimonas_sp.AAC.1